MILFDALLIVAVSALLALKSFYLGAVTLIIACLLAFQNFRTIRLLGLNAEPVSTQRKAKALALAVVISACAIPLAMEKIFAGNEASGVSPLSEEAVLPVVILLGLFSAAMMCSLFIEKRKR